MSRAQVPAGERPLEARSIARIRRRFASKIDEVRDEYDDGVWFYLKAGWQLDGCHSVHAWSVEQAENDFSGVSECACDECVPQGAEVCS